LQDDDDVVDVDVDKSDEANAKIRTGVVADAVEKSSSDNDRMLVIVDHNHNNYSPTNDDDKNNNNMTYESPKFEMQEKREFEQASELLTIKNFNNSPSSHEPRKPIVNTAASVSPPTTTTKKSVSFRPAVTFEDIDNELRQATREAAESSANFQRLAASPSSSRFEAAELEAKHLADIARVERLRAEIERMADV
jgi:hypothetical protein